MWGPERSERFPATYASSVLMTDDRTDSGLFSLAENHVFYFVSRASEDLRNQGGDGSE
jgi:hypothetical protein